MHIIMPFLTVALISYAASAGAQSSSSRQRDTTRVVFVCEHGSVKSIVAATIFNRLAMERGVAARAISRGTAPDLEIPRLVRDGLRAEGADIGEMRPKGLGPSDARGASMFVLFDVDLPSRVTAAVPIRRWDGTPSVMSSYPAGRDAIAVRVAELLTELERTVFRTADPPRRPH